MRAVVTGATGLIGRELIPRLESAVVLSRDPSQAKQKLSSVEAYAWDPETSAPPAAAMSGADTVFNLAGEPVGEGRWTRDKKRRIRDSRVLGTRNLVAGLAALERPPHTLISASAVGYYGDRGDETLDETSAVGGGFLADVCAEWEHEAFAAEHLGLRVVCVRIGVVLARGGGALARMAPLFRFGAGGRLGNGRQWMPWIHLDDVVGILMHVSRNSEIHGAVNAVSPQPVTNADFTNALGRALRRPALLPVPRTALRVAFGEMSDVLLASQRVFPKAAERTGYVFKNPDLGRALDAVLNGALGARTASR